MRWLFVHKFNLLVFVYLEKYRFSISIIIRFLDMLKENLRKLLISQSTQLKSFITSYWLLNYEFKLHCSVLFINHQQNYFFHHIVKVSIYLNPLYEIPDTICKIIPSVFHIVFNSTDQRLHDVFHRRYCYTLSVFQIKIRDMVLKLGMASSRKRN